jgi:phospholipase C
MKSITHVVVLMMENRSFDEYFGTFPGVNNFFSSSSAIPQPWPGQPNNELFPEAQAIATAPSPSSTMRSRPRIA